MITIRRGFIVVRLVCALAIVAGTATAALGATASWDRNSEPDVMGYKLSYGTQPGLHTVTIDVGNVSTWQFFPPAGQRYYVVVQAYNAAGELSAKSAEAIVDVPLANRAPTLVQPASQTSLLNASVLTALSANDPDGTPIAFKASGLPPGVSINAASGIISGLVLAKGTYAVSITVSDGVLTTSKTFTWTVIEKVSAPIVVDVRPLDTTLYLGDANFSATDWLLAYTWPANRVAAAILMKFNLSPIPSNATIVSAALNLSLTSADGNVTDPNYAMSVHQVMTRNPDIARATARMADGVSAWTANQCCASGFPMAQADISTARSATTVSRTPGITVFDATSIARAWLSAPATNYGLLLNADTSKGSDRYRLFGSMEDPVEARRPFLRVTYTVPVPLPAGVILTTLTSPIPPEQSSLRVSGDFDGDGREDLSTYSAGEWRIWTSRSAFTSTLVFQWGGVGDVPVAADYDGDKLTDPAVYRPNSGNWEIWLSKTQQAMVLQWGGMTNDKPATSDVDGDGKADVTIIRDDVYWILLSSTNYSTRVIGR